jgi:hypothetical protein
MILCIELGHGPLTVAQNQNRRGTGKIRDKFMKEASKGMSFEEATGFFESHGIKINVKG